MKKELGTSVFAHAELLELSAESDE